VNGPLAVQPGQDRGLGRALGGPEGPAVDEVAAALGASQRRGRLGDHGGDGGQREAGGQFEEGHLALVRNSAIGIQEPVGADLHDPRRQDVLEEAPDELQHVQRQGAQPLASELAIAEPDGAVRDLDDAAGKTGRSIFIVPIWEG
jgi:hypothetical protein